MEYTEQDEILIGKLQSELFEACENIAKKESDMELVRKAFYFAKEAHKGARRKSGEPYIIHPIAVALIVVKEIELGTKSVISALLHDVVEDTEYTVSDIEHLFGPKIASMVDGLTKISGVFSADPNESETSKQAENFKKMLLTLSDDVRVIIIKIADRLHNMRTLGSMPAHKQIKITSETIYLFAPLAHRLGLFAIKTELEDLSLKYRFPGDYKMIESKIHATEANRNKYIEKFNAPITDILKANDIDFEVSGRVKSIYSIWRKIQRKNIDFEEIYDIFAIRIVFKPSPMIPEKSQCWHIYSLITDIYKPKPDRIKDWVNIPKANGYEALHCTVMGLDGEWVEVQIRSQRMEEIAEKGFAAHWKYKEQSSRNDDGEIDKWLKRVREALNSSVENAVEFLDNFKLSLYSSEIVVFTPKGDQITLPQGATALDFAYDIHSKIGHTAVGAKINHKINSIFTPISSGDQIEIISSNNVKPKAEWLEHVVTSKAKNSIKNFLKKDNQNNIERGIIIFEEKMKSFGIQPSARVFRKVLPAYNSSSKSEFYSKLGAGIINLNGVEKILRQNAASKMIKYWSLQLSNPLRLLKGSGNNDGKKKTEDQEIKPADIENAQFTIAECCSPIPGDQVIGFRSEDGHVVVHKKSCKEAVKFAAQHGENIVKAQWSGFKAVAFLSHIEVRGIDRMGIMLDMSKLLSEEMNINIRELKLQSHDGIFEGIISLYVKSIDDLKIIMSRLNKIRGVETVRRIETYRE